jgi:DNA-binding CsgD family transcriptional regulator
MLVLGSQMHVVTLIFTILEVLLFFYQFIYYLSRPQDKNRFWYLILLLLLIIYNITGGLFPDPNIDMPIVTQNIIAYGCGFFMASYFPYYFYKGFDLKRLRFHAIYGVPLFLLLPYLIFFVVGYSKDKNLDAAIEYGIIVPLFYALVLLWAITRAIRSKYREREGGQNSMEMVAVYFAIIPWASMPVLSLLRASQLVEVLFTNGGFIIITILFISKSISKARIEYQQLINLPINDIKPSSFLNNCSKYQLTNREVEIVQFIRQGYKYKKIADRLFISESTVKKHVQHIFEKVDVSNKVELIHALEQGK